MASTKDYDTAYNTISAWLQKYASMYSGMIPQNYKVSMAHAIVNAVDAERAGKSATAMTALEETAPLEPLGASFAIEMLLNSLGIYGADRQTVEIALPTMQQAVALANANRNVAAQFAQYWQTAGPAVQIIAKAAAGNK